MATYPSAHRRWLVALAVVLLAAVSSCTSPADSPAPSPGTAGPEPSVATSAASAGPAVTETNVRDAGAKSLAITGDWLSAGDTDRPDDRWPPTPLEAKRASEAVLVTVKGTVQRRRLVNMSRGSSLSVILVPGGTGWQ